MPKVDISKFQQKNKFKKGITINNNGKPLLIKQLNIVEAELMYQAIMVNIKQLNTIFHDALDSLEENETN